MGFWPRLAIGLLGSIALSVAGWFAGWHFCAVSYEARIATINDRAKTIALLDTQARTQATMASAVKALAERERVQTVTRTIVEKVPIYVPKEVDKPVPVGFVRLFNASAGGYALPDAAPGDNAATSETLLSAVARTTAKDFGVCAGYRTELTQAQDWINAQLALNPKTK